VTRASNLCSQPLLNLRVVSSCVVDHGSIARLNIDYATRYDHNCSLKLDPCNG